MKKKLITTLFITFLTLPNISFGADDDLKELTDAINDAQKEFNELKTGITSETKIIDDAIKEIDKATEFAKAALENNNTKDAIKALKFIEKNHSRICSLHLKDRQASKSSNYVGSDNQIWGQGDTPIKEVLLLMQKNSYDFTATIELEYRIPDGSTPVKEVIKCMDYCKAVLNS